MTISFDYLHKFWVSTDTELVGPFDTEEYAQAWIDDRDDHGYNTQWWYITKLKCNPMQRNTYTVTFGNVVKTFTEEQFLDFIKTAVIRNKDISNFIVNRNN